MFTGVLDECPKAASMSLSGIDSAPESRSARKTLRQRSHP
jgi:hypothetical protein